MLKILQIHKENVKGRQQIEVMQLKKIILFCAHTYTHTYLYVYTMCVHVHKKE